MPDTEAPVTSFSQAFAKASTEAAATAPTTEAPPAEKPPEKAAEEQPPPPRELFKKDEAAAEPVKTGVDAIAEPDFRKETKARPAWEALKKEAKAQEMRAADLERQINERKAKGLDAETLETRLAEKEAKLKEYDAIVARAALDEHPDFRREFIDGRAKLISKAQQIIGESDGDVKAVETALNLSGKARVEALREIAGDLDNFQSGRLGRVIDELTDLDERALEKRSAAKESYKVLQEQANAAQAEQALQHEKSRRYEFEQTASKLRGSLEVLTKVEGHDAWNARADRIVQEAKDYCAAHGNADIEAEILARSAQVYRDLFVEADKQVSAREAKIAELEAELKAIHGKSPSLAARQNGAKAEPTRSPFSDMLANAFADTGA